MIKRLAQPRSEKLLKTRQLLEAALEEATDAGIAAVREFTAEAPCSSGGHIADTCGWAYVMVSHPTYHFREALKLLDPEAHGLRAQWIVLGFTRKGFDKGASQSITAHEIACKAGRSILEREFPDLNFYIRSRVE